MGCSQTGPLDPDCLKTLAIRPEFTHVEDCRSGQQYFIYKKYFKDEAAYHEAALRYETRRKHSHSLSPAVIHFEILEQKTCRDLVAGLLIL